MVLEERLGALGLEHAECKAWRTARHEYWRLAAEAGGSDAVVSMAGESRGGINGGME